MDTTKNGNLGTHFHHFKTFYFYFVFLVNNSLAVWRDSFLTLFDYLQILKDIHYPNHGWNYVNPLT